MKDIKLYISGIIFLIISLGTGCNPPASDLKPVFLRTEYKENPFVEETQPRLSWELESDQRSQYQTAYQILVADSPDALQKNEGNLWNSGKIFSSAMNQIHYEGTALPSGQKAWWKVRTWDKSDRPGTWSESATWEMGKLQDLDWRARWIGYNTNHLAKPGKYHLPPSPYLRKGADINKPVRSARLYVTSLGLQEFYINGERIGQDYFAPGWTDYDQRVYYQVYDVTRQLKEGKNTFGAILANGWYAGYLGYALLVGSETVNRFYGEFPLLKAQIDIEYTDGSKESVITDDSWKASTGAVTEADILQGETNDARLEPQGWLTPVFDASSWKGAEVVRDEHIRAKLQIYPGEPVRVVKELPAVEVTSVEDGKYIFNFGQNFAGIVRLRVRGNAGDSVVLRYGEMLYPDGRLVTENLRSARATDTYVLQGAWSGEYWSPKFTYHGFQYVEVSGLKSRPDKDLLTGLVMTSDLRRVGDFKTDNEMINQLYSNITWTQWANYFDIPTDCPQRDERQGWTCDAQVYIGSAKFNNDIAAFHKKWIRDLNDGQWDNGAYPIYAPIPQKDQVALIRKSDTYSPGWSDAGIVCPYEIYAAYGDLRVVEESMPYMKKYMNFLREKSGNTFVLKEDSFNEISPRGGFGDWLSVGDQTGPDLLATIFYFHNARLMTEMCAAIGDASGTIQYKEEAEKIRQAFKKHYMNEDGTLRVDVEKYKDYPLEKGRKFSGHTQTAYASALYFEILEAEDALKAGRILRQLVTDSGDKLTTGFLGFKSLMPALTAAGSADKAYRLFFSTEYPSLGYEVVNGATSIWERWDSYIKDKGFIHNASMNSFSHYAFGSVCEWMFEGVAGIQRRGAGYRSYSIRPEIPGTGITRLSSSYHSISGEIHSDWEVKGDVLEQKIKIPVNTTAFCYFPTTKISDIRIDGMPVKAGKEIHSISEENGYTVLELGSGSYHFETRFPGP